MLRRLARNTDESYKVYSENERGFKFRSAATVSDSQLLMFTCHINSVTVEKKLTYLTDNNVNNYRSNVRRRKRNASIRCLSVCMSVPLASVSVRFSTSVRVILRQKLIIKIGSRMSRVRTFLRHGAVTKVYIGPTVIDVTESMVTIGSPFCGYNLA